MLVSDLCICKEARKTTVLGEVLTFGPELLFRSLKTSLPAD